jgi:two-component system, sensor histidine kinase
MIEILRDDYLKSKTQIIVINNDREIIETDNMLFNFELNSKIESIHPFFSILEGMLLQPDTETIFNGVHIEYQGKKKIVEIIINSGNSEMNPFLIFIDFTYYYANFQSLAQEKNESVLSFHLEELKTQQLKAENAFKDKFLANISHDLKTPIWGTNFYVSMLESTELTDNQLGMITTIKETNNHVMRLVDDLLEISKAESGQINIINELFNIVTCIDQVQKIIVPKIEAKDLEFKLKTDVNIASDLIGDKNRIIQILINLLDNSIKFTEKGSITLEANQKSLNDNEVVLIFKVIDTGSGINTNNKEEVFKSFKKLHNSSTEGLGLGLSIVANLIKMMHGTIDYTTQINKGTTFTIELPLKKAQSILS